MGAHQFLVQFLGDSNLRDKLNRTFERTRNQAVLFRFLQRTSRLFGNGTNLDLQVRMDLEIRELGHAIDSIKPAGHVAPKRRPGEPRRASDSSKGQDEAVTDGADQQGLGRPAIPWSIELSRRG
jgi:hypothetical protein